MAGDLVVFDDDDGNALAGELSEVFAHEMCHALAGVKGELAIKLFGPDVFVLESIQRPTMEALQLQPQIWVEPFPIRQRCVWSYCLTYLELSSKKESNV